MPQAGAGTAARSLLAGAGPHVNVLAIADVPFFRLEQADPIDQPAELGVAVITRVEVGRLLVDDAADRAESRPASVVGGGLDRVAKQAEQVRIATQLLRR